ncbi:hypothetical protein HEK616_30480 [Streptomyces nigrescens]|uniref:Integral membrane protein n=2 Tax=Streptomyces TaxID=1883 RepID=A0ABM7ZT66_STRNI|nr:hypothetical protein [Streptomyces nigrescens]MEE4418097.1 hypothetical protein [Streptomyces sp. DSM 41528]BDM69561.1 hypothetical protein HEK616_30480 [Streptomyces nigrescens]
MRVDAITRIAEVRRTLLRPARPAPAGIRVRVAVWLTVACSLVYVGQKVYMAARGEVGMPGHPAPAPVQAQFAHPGWAQAGNASLGLLAALVAWATTARWAARIPRWALLCALAPTVVLQSLGAAITIQRADLDLAHLGWGPVDEVVMGSVGIAAWIVVAVSYVLRSRPHAGVVAGAHP